MRHLAVILYLLVLAVLSTTNFSVSELFSSIEKEVRSWSYLDDEEDGAVFGASGTFVRPICDPYVLAQVNAYSVFYDPVGGIVDLSKAPGAQANRFYIDLEEDPVARGALEGFIYNGQQYVVKFNNTLQNPFLGYYLKSESTDTGTPLDVVADPSLDTSAATKVIMECSMNEIRFPGDPSILTYDCDECFAQFNESFFTQKDPNFYTQLFESDASFVASFNSAIDDAVSLINSNIGSITTTYPADDASKVHLINYDQFATTTTAGISGSKDASLKEVENLLQDLYRITSDDNNPVHFVVLFQSVDFVFENNLWNVYAQKVLAESNLKNLDDVVLVTIPYSLPAINGYSNPQKAYWMPGLSVSKPNRVTVSNLGTESYDAEHFDVFLKDVFAQTVKPYDYYSYVVDCQGRVQFSRINLGEWKSGYTVVNDLAISIDPNFYKYNRALEVQRLQQEATSTPNSYVLDLWASDLEDWANVRLSYDEGTYTPTWKSSDINLKSYCVRQYHSQYFNHYLTDHFEDFKRDNNLTDPGSVPAYAKINPLADDPVLEAIDFFSLLTATVGMDVIFDAMGVVYVYGAAPENEFEISVRTAVLMLPFMNGGVVKIGKEGVEKVTTNSLKNFGKKGAGNLAANAGAVFQLTY